LKNVQSDINPERSHCIGAGTHPRVGGANLSCAMVVVADELGGFCGMAMDGSVVVSHILIKMFQMD